MSVRDSPQIVRDTGQSVREPFTIISTFSGCGGSSQGYKQAGGKVLLSVEWEENAAQTYRLNFPQTELYHGDIAKLSVEEALGRTCLRPGELDIFDGSPPCQGFSTAGRRQMEDNRNQLFLEYCRLLRGLQPKTFIMENVRGMIIGNMKVIFAEILAMLKDCGYNVRAELLNAKHYGVAQSRERMIFIGVRDDLGIEPSHPVGSAKTISLRQACVGIDAVGPALVRKCRELYPHTPRGKNLAFANTKLGRKANNFNAVRLSWDKPSPTVTKTVSPAMAGLFHPDVPHLLSIAAIKRVASFPDEFQFIGKFEEQWARIGNCVPPKFMEAIARHVHTEILMKIEDRVEVEA
jgi:DNA (cytosine-5)-methyltransferase 1